jgi:hypothetical protein
MGSKRFVDWAFEHYLSIAPPSFAEAGAPRPPLGKRGAREDEPALAA